MPDGMSHENSSIDSMRNLGAIPGHESPKTPAPYGMSESSARMLEEHNRPWQEQSGNIPGSVKSEREIRNQATDPNSRDYIMEQFLAGMGGHERMPFTRDRLSLMYEPSKFSDSLLDLAEIPVDMPPGLDEKQQETFKRKEIEAKKEAIKSYRMVEAAGQRNLLSTIDMLEALKEPAPFNSRSQEMHFEGAQNALAAIATYFEGDIPERVAGLYHIYDQVNEQQNGLFQILLAAGGSIQGYYDALKQSGETLLDRGRIHANVVNMRSAFADKDPGVTTFSLTDAERAQIPENLRNAEHRKEQIRCLSEARMFIMLGGDVSQYDIEKPRGQEGILKLTLPYSAEKIQAFEADGQTEKATAAKKANEEAKKTFEAMNVENARFFTRLVFGGNGETGGTDENKWVTWKINAGTPNERSLKTPREILTWFGGGDKVEDREVWLSRMITIITNKDEQGRGLWERLPGMNEDQIRAVAKEIVKQAEEYRTKHVGDKVYNSRFEVAAAKIAVMSWVEMDKAFQTSGRLAWRFNYKDIFGKTERVFDMGGIYKAYDSVNLMYYWRRWVMYKGGWKSATQFFMAGSDHFRREVYKHAPDWLPPLDWALKDKKMKAIWDRLVLPEYHDYRIKRLAGKGTSQQEIDKLIAEGKIVPDLDPSILKNITNPEVAWSLETPWESADKKKISVFMLLPKKFEYMNVWKYMVADKETGESIWDMYARGVMPKDIPWDKFNFETLDRMWVSMSMMFRFTKLWVDPIEAERDPFLQAFFKDASGQSVSELAKRIYLAFRDLPEGYQQLTVQILPFAIVQQTANDAGLFKQNLTTISKKEMLQKWNFLMAKWIRAIKWLPPAMLDDDQLYVKDSETRTLSVQDQDKRKKMIINMSNGVALVTMAYKQAFERLSQGQFGTDKRALERIYNDQVGLYGDSNLADIYKNEGEEASFPGDIPPETFSMNGEDDFAKKFFGRE